MIWITCSTEPKTEWEEQYEKQEGGKKKTKLKKRGYCFIFLFSILFILCVWICILKEGTFWNAHMHLKYLEPSKWDSAALSSAAAGAAAIPRGGRASPPRRGPEGRPCSGQHYVSLVVVGSPNFTSLSQWIFTEPQWVLWHMSVNTDFR